MNQNSTFLLHSGNIMTAALPHVANCEQSESRLSSNIHEKATPILGCHSISGYASVFCLDQENHFIMPWAFERSLTAWKKANKSIPLHSEHQGDPVGIIENLWEDSRGLYVEQARFFDTDSGRENKRFVDSGEKRGFSVSFFPIRCFAHEQRTYFLEVMLIEISITQRGCNPHSIVESKTAEQKEDQNIWPAGLQSGLSTKPIPPPSFVLEERGIAEQLEKLKNLLQN